jgi:heterodisulfide reductase subunit D
MDLVDRTSGPERPRTSEALAVTWRNEAYNCYSSGHKFCREVCPVYQVTRDETYLPTAFHANVVAMEQGLIDVADVASDYTACTMCGGCELRCPNTLFVGDFYRFRTRTVDVVRAVRTLAVDQGIEDPAWASWNQATDRDRHEPVVPTVGVELAREWASDLDLPLGGETVLFVDCEAAFYRRSLPRAVAYLFRLAGEPFGLQPQPWCCGGPAAEMGYADQARRFAEHNVADWRAAGARRIVVLDPHDYITFTEDYPRYFGDNYDVEVELALDVVAGWLREGRIRPERPINARVTYHDPCRLNKRKGIWQAPREILAAIPGLDFVDVDRVTQWSYCSGGGGGLAIARPELTERLSERRIDFAADLQVDALVTACPWAERPLGAAGARRDLAVIDLMELLAIACGAPLEVPGWVR